MPSSWPKRCPGLVLVRGSEVAAVNGQIATPAISTAACAMGRAISGSQVGVFAALVLTCADQLERKLLGRPQIYAPRAIARRLFGVRSLFGRARQARVRGLALRAVYS